MCATTSTDRARKNSTRNPRGTRVSSARGAALRRKLLALSSPCSTTQTNLQPAMPDQEASEEEVRSGATQTRLPTKSQVQVRQEGVSKTASTTTEVGGRFGTDESLQAGPRVQCEIDGK